MCSKLKIKYILNSKQKEHTPHNNNNKTNLGKFRSTKIDFFLDSKLDRVHK